jgi:hypothetical protein
LFAIFIEDNGRFMDEESRYRHSEWPTYVEALVEARRLVNLSLEEAYRPGMRPDTLYGWYTSFGDDVFIVPDGEPRFSAWEYARSRAEEMCRAAE